MLFRSFPQSKLHACFGRCSIHFFTKLYKMHLKLYMRCRLTAAWKFLENFSMHFAKKLCIFLWKIQQNFASFCYQFLQNFILQNNQLKIYFGIFTKFFMQLRKLSMHIILYYMQSVTELRL